jgi:hypothetical protein
MSPHSLRTLANDTLCPPMHFVLLPPFTSPLRHDPCSNAYPFAHTSPWHSYGYRCKGTSICFLTSSLFYSTLLYSPPLYHTHPCSYVHSPTLCTITRRQTLKADDSWTSKTSTRTLINYYCHRPSTFPLHSYLSRIRQTSDALGQVRVTLRHPPPSRGHPYMGGLVLGGLVL